MRISFDSNVLVYAADIKSGAKHAQAVELMFRATGADCFLTLQALAEFYAVTTRKGKCNPSESLAFIEDWCTSFQIHAADEVSLLQAIKTANRHGLPFWDAMIWSTAK